MSLDTQIPGFLRMPFELQQRVLGFVALLNRSSLKWMALTHSSWTDAARDGLYRHIILTVVTPDEWEEDVDIDSHPWLSPVRRLARTVSQNQSLAARVRILHIDFSIYLRGKEFEDAVTDFASCLRHMQDLQYLYLRTLDKGGVLFDELTYFLAHNATKLRGLRLARLVTDIAVECDVIAPLFDAICDLGKRTDERLVLVVHPEMLSEIDFSRFAKVPLSAVKYDDRYGDSNASLWLDLSAYSALDSNPDLRLEAYLQDVRREFARGAWDAGRWWSKGYRRNGGLLPYQLHCLDLYITPEEIGLGVLRRTLDIIASSPRLDDLKTFCLRFPEGQDPLPTAALLAALAPPIRVPCHIRIVQKYNDAPPMPLDVDPEQLVVALGKGCPSLRVVSLSSVVWRLQDMSCNRWERLVPADVMMLLPALLYS